MRIDIVTIFPEMVRAPLETSIVARARAEGIVEIAVYDLRAWTEDRHRSVDDAPYGGGAGMVMRPEPLFRCVEQLRAEAGPPGRTVLLSPQGRLLNHDLARELSNADRLILLCGRYEGFDERVRLYLADDEVSIGDYVLGGGELPALVVVEAIVRLLPGALGSVASLDEESHTDGLLEYPQYTRPQEFRGWSVPEVLLSGDHAAIARWRRAERLRRTAARRPDLLERANLAEEDRAVFE